MGALSERFRSAFRGLYEGLTGTLRNMSAPESALLSAPMRKRSHKERGLYEDLRALSFQKFSPPKALGALSSHRPNIVKKLENHLYFFLSSFPLPSPSLQ